MTTFCHPLFSELDAGSGRCTAAQPAELFKQSTLLFGQLLWHNQLDLDEEIAAPSASPGHSLAAQAECTSVLRPRRNTEVAAAGQRAYPYVTAKSGDPDGDFHVRVEIVTAALELRVRCELDLEIEIAPRPVVNAGMTLAGNTQTLPILNSRRDLDLNALTRRAAGAVRDVDNELARAAVVGLFERDVNLLF
jgi:hypothetical protein